MTGVHRDTIMRLSVRVGNGCAHLMELMRDLACRRVQLDVRRSQPMLSARMIVQFAALGIRTLTTLSKLKCSSSELNTGRRRYSPPLMVESALELLLGNPNPDHISTVSSNGRT